MAIEDRQAQLMAETQAIKHFYNIDVTPIKAAFKVFADLYESPEHVDSEAFSNALNAVDAAIEDLCLLHKIVQERLEERMEDDKSYQDVEI